MVLPAEMRNRFSAVAALRSAAVSSDILAICCAGAATIAVKICWKCPTHLSMVLLKNKSLEKITVPTISSFRSSMATVRSNWESGLCDSMGSSSSPGSWSLSLGTFCKANIVWNTGL
jgi:hypothetical protein